MLYNLFSHSFLNCIQGDYATITMHMKKLPMFTDNLWMGCLQPDTMSIILSSYQHYDKQQFQTLSSELYTFFPVLKLDLAIRSTVTRLHSCSGKKYAYAVRASCSYIEINIFDNF